MMDNNRTQVNYIVGILEDNTVLFIHEFFEHSDDFKGAVGSIHEAITEDYVEEQKDPYNNWDSFKDLWKDAVAADRTEDSLEDYIDMLCEPYNYDGLFPFDDPSFRYEFDNAFKMMEDYQQQEILKALSFCTNEDFVSMENRFYPPVPDDLDESDYMQIYNNCISCGRCVGDHIKLKVVFDDEILKKVAEYEGLNVDDLVTEDVKYVI